MDFSHFINKQSLHITYEWNCMFNELFMLSVNYIINICLIIAVDFKPIELEVKRGNFS